MKRFRIETWGYGKGKTASVGDQKACGHSFSEVYEMECHGAGESCFGVMGDGKGNIDCTGEGFDTASYNLDELLYEETLRV